MNSDKLKVMIVDDEEMVRSRLRICIDWDEIGMVIAEEASSASEALQIIEQSMPDIIFTDICMPLLDGLEFSRMVIERYPYMKIIIITAHEEFEYAKNSIKVGVSDFILKPINKTEIKNVALRIKQKIEKEKSHREEYVMLKHQLNESIPYLRDIFLNQIIQHSIDIENITEKLDFFKINILSNHYQIAVFLSEYSRDNNERGEEDKILLCMQIKSTILQYFRDDQGIFIFLDYNGRVLVFCNNHELDLVECCEQIKVMVINNFNCFISIGIGNIYAELKNIKRSYKEACDALNYRIVIGRNHVITYNEISLCREKNSIEYEGLSDVTFFVKAGIEKSAANTLERIFDEAPIDTIATIEQIRILSANIVSAIFNTVSELGINFKDIYDTETLKYSHIFKIETLPEMKKYLKSFVLETIHTIKSMRSRKTNHLINKVIDYVNQNITNSRMTLAAIASEFYVNPNYLSRAFKQETGQTFSEYLVKVRMEKAILLLQSTDLKAYEIAESIGISDPYYFSTCFKKYSGTTINAYRKNK